VTHEERLLIDALFERLSSMEGAQRDPDAEALIADKLQKNPGAAYALAQTVLMQNQELAALEARLVNLQARLGRSEMPLPGSRRTDDALVAARVMGRRDTHSFLGTAAGVALAVVGL
jgi:hypothetical protein